MAVYKGKDARIILGTTTLGYVESASVDIGKGAEGYYEVGSPHPVEIVQGNVEITGSISRVWMDTTLAELVGTVPEEVLTAFNLEFRASTDSGAPTIKIGGCKVESGSLDLSQDGFLMGDIDFIASDYTITTLA